MTQAERLTREQVAEAGLADWRPLLGRLRTRFATGDFGAGMGLVTRIGEVATAAGRHADLTLTEASLVVGVGSPHAGGVTQADVDLARVISEQAASLGIAADTGGVTQLELGLDTGDTSRNAAYYAALLGGEVVGGEPYDASGQVPTVWWQTPPERPEDEGPALPKQDFEQRWHFDVWVAEDEGEPRVQAALDAGGRLVSDKAAPAYWVLEDPDGNRSCVCTPAAR
ncbi:VOC family protein [Knoellia koreensis]|uniref:Putative pterin-4-alpha-carbinolamine dehydratase n=1 Tax=Knoellia koreensis TaxID=2730921 RepID=A0A849HE46_9MICO|nr:VOC family protein [Knoellia sp. DB2414S]NNM45562.1 4a-hydroxytetrahydrobiopterin dehydratase [Knoellia sp. DB2414S]